MGRTSQFTYRGTAYSITVSKSAKGKFVGIPGIEGVNLDGQEIGAGRNSEQEAFDQAEAIVKAAIDKLEN